MDLDPQSARAILARTPAVLRALLADLGEEWTRPNEGGDTFSPHDVVGHLIHGEKTDWTPRVRRILADGESVPFEPFDRFAHRGISGGTPMSVLLDEFAALRAENLAYVDGLRLAPEDLARTGTHPAIGRVTLGQLLATWVVHDLGHLSQITRVMAKQYREAVGPWTVNLGVLSK